eukprot:g41160.t1
MEDSEICVEHPNMLGQFEIKKEVVLDLLTSIKVATGEVLEDWRIAHVVPLFKKGNRDNPEDYRQNWLAQRRQRVAVEGCFSGWRSVTSSAGIRAGTSAVCDVDENVDGCVSKFAVDTKTGVVDRVEDCQRTQVGNRSVADMGGEMRHAREFLEAWYSNQNSI